MKTTECVIGIGQEFMPGWIDELTDRDKYTFVQDPTNHQAWTHVDHHVFSPDNLNIMQVMVASMMAAYEQTTPVNIIQALNDPNMANRLRRRMTLIEEETNETCAAGLILLGESEMKPDGIDDNALHDERAKYLAEYIDGLCDTLVVTIGGFVDLGINMQAFFTEVMKSNASKMGEDGRPIKREDGKFLKGPNYKAPEIEARMRSDEANLDWCADNFSSYHYDVLVDNPGE